MKLTLKLAISLISLLISLLSLKVNAATCTSTGTGNWSNTGTWSCSAVPTSSDDVVVASGHTITVDTNAVARSILVNATGILNMSGSNILTVSQNTSADAMTISGTFNGGAGAISVTNSTSGYKGIYVSSGTFNAAGGDISIVSKSHGIALANISSNFNAGAGAISTTSNGGAGLNSSGNFVGGTGAITLPGGGLANNATGVLTVGSGGISISNLAFGGLDSSGTINLNGNLSVATTSVTGSTTFSGSGKIMLLDNSHTITGPNIYNLEIAPLTAPRTITISGALTVTGTIVLNGSSSTNLISFTGGGSVTPPFTSYYCASSNVTGITCSNIAPSAISAAIDLSSTKTPTLYSEELNIK